MARRLGYWVSVLTVVTLSGVLYGLISKDGHLLPGALYGLCAGGAVILFEQGVVLARLRRRLLALPWLASVLATEMAYLAMILCGSALAGVVLWWSGAIDEPLRKAVVLGPVTIVYALAVSAIVITMSRMRDLIGAETFRNVLLGRYFHPVEEERIFLFIDLIGSTEYAQAHGDLRAQSYLGAIFAALAEPVRASGGAIDDYIGDMAMVTWPMGRGLAGSRCVTAVFDFLDAIEAEAAEWLRRYGQVPRFRAALHGGRVVTAEVGIDRRKIAYFGDVVNTTGRMEALCRTLDTAFLMSADLHARLGALPGGIVPTRLGAHALKGRGQHLDVLAIRRTAPSQRTAA